MTRHLKTKFIVFLALLFIFVFPLLIVSAEPNLKYDPMETLPGFAKTADFATFISNLYKFGIWTVGICALVMIVIGGYMYAASGGNNASMEKAKGFITDAIVGLILALLAYLILYIINPKLIEIKMGTTATTTIATAPGAVTPGEGTTGDTCSQGACSQAAYTNLSNAINSNSYGIDSKIMKSLLIGGEGCNKSQPPPSQSSSACGYSQVLGKYRKSICGLTGTNAETCVAVQNDIQLDVNCGAAVVKEQSGWCKKGTDGIDRVSRCYGDQTEKYVTKATNYYVTCK